MSVKSTNCRALISLNVDHLHMEIVLNKKGALGSVREIVVFV